MIAGPSTLTALLNAIRVGFRSALIHRQAGEISKLLQKVRSEFDKYGNAVQTAYKRAERTVAAIGQLQTRQNVMGKALRGIDLLSADTPIDAATMMWTLRRRSLIQVRKKWTQKTKMSFECAQALSSKATGYLMKH
jgi:DNA anti-recombination protein RmuC